MTQFDLVHQFKLSKVQLKPKFSDESWNLQMLVSACLQRFEKVLLQRESLVWNEL